AHRRRPDRRVPAGDPSGGHRPRHRAIRGAAETAATGLGRGSNVPDGNRGPCLSTGEGKAMRTLHFGLRVADLDRSLAFYTAVGYEIVGHVPETGLGHLTMLKLPGDEFVTIELVHNPTEAAVNVGSRLSHFVIQVESMDVTLAQLAARDIDAETPTS